MARKKIDKQTLGKTMIWSAIKLDDALTELIKLEVKLCRRHLKNNSEVDLRILNQLIKNIVMALMLTEDKIKDGIELLKEKDDGDA